MDHSLSRVATKGPGKFRHVANHIIHTIPVEECPCVMTAVRAISGRTSPHHTLAYDKKNACS